MYEAILDLIVVGVLLLVRRWRVRNSRGDQIILALALHMVCRWIIEFWRDDDRDGEGDGGIWEPTQPQRVCLSVLAVFVVGKFFVSRSVSV